MQGPGNLKYIDTESAGQACPNSVVTKNSLEKNMTYISKNILHLVG